MARIKSDQLSSHLSRQLLPAYVVTGDEPLQVQESCDLIRQAARKNGFTERELYHTDAGFDWDSLYEAANSLSLFGDRKIIEIRVHNGKIDEKASKSIQEFCASGNEDTLLMLVLPKVDKRALNSKWAKALDQYGGIVQVWPVNAQQLPRWLDQRLKKAGLNASSDAIELLANKVEGNLLAAVQEVEKLKLIAPTDQAIDSATMSRSVMSSARYDVYSLIDRALAGDSRAASQTLLGLKDEGTEPILLLWALSREIKTLHGIKEKLETGRSFDAAAKAHGIWENRKSLVRHAVNRLSMQTLIVLTRKSTLIDKTIKGVSKGNVWNLLLDTTLVIAGSAALSEKSQAMEYQLS